MEEWIPPLGQKEFSSLYWNEQSVRLAAYTMTKKKKRIQPAIDTSPWWRHPDPLIWLGLALIAAAVCVYVLFDPKLSIGGDNALYLSLAKSLLQGTGYREIWSPGAPLHVQYPPGYPVLISPLVWLFPQSVVPIKLLSAVLFLLAIAGMYLLFRGQMPDLWQGAVLFLVAINPIILEFSHLELSEMASFFALVAALGLFKRWLQRGAAIDRWLILMASAMACCFYMRAQGIVVGIAALVFLLLKRRYRQAWWLAAILALLIMPWVLWVKLHAAGGGGNYSNIFLAKYEYNLDQGKITFLDLMIRLVNNLKSYGLEIIPSFMFPGGENYLLVTIPITLIWTYGYASQLRGGVDITHLVVLLWLLPPLLYSPVCAARFMIPIVPFIVLFFFRGLSAVARRISSRLASAAAIFALVVMVMLNAAVVVPQAENNLPALKGYIDGDRYAGYDPNWVSFFQAADWVRGHTPDSAVVVSRKPALFYLVSQRKALCYPYTANRDSVVAAIARADYVMVEPVSGTTQRYLIPAVEPLLNTKFTIVYQGGSPPTFALQVNKEKTNATDNETRNEEKH